MTRSTFIARFMRDLNEDPMSRRNAEHAFTIYEIGNYLNKHSAGMVPAIFKSIPDFEDTYYHVYQMVQNMKKTAELQTEFDLLEYKHKEIEQGYTDETDEDEDEYDEDEDDYEIDPDDESMWEDDSEE